MSEANKRQVGGGHYCLNNFQHWDLVVALDLGFLLGNALKYVLRHKDKKGKQDLEKALHYLEKEKEMSTCLFYTELMAPNHEAAFAQYRDSYELDEWQVLIFEAAISYRYAAAKFGTGDNFDSIHPELLVELMVLVNEYMEDIYPEKEAGQEDMFETQLANDLIDDLL